LKTINQIKDQYTDIDAPVEQSVSLHYLYDRIYKELQKLNTKRTQNSIAKWKNELNRLFSKEVQIIT
jgi:hypothetical protein